MNAPDEVPASDRPVCEDYIGEEYLADMIARTGVAAVCYYCSNAGQTISIGQLSEHVERMLDQHYVRTASEPEGYEYYLQRETGNWDRSGELVALRGQGLRNH